MRTLVRVCVECDSNKEIRVAYEYGVGWTRSQRPGPSGKLQMSFHPNDCLQPQFLDAYFWQGLNRHLAPRQFFDLSPDQQAFVRDDMKGILATLAQQHPGGCGPGSFTWPNYSLEINTYAIAGDAIGFTVARDVMQHMG